jgi:hypothetical protein
VRAAVEVLPLRAQPERARELRAVLRAEGRLPAARVWRSLALVSLWTDAHAARAVPAVRERFPHAELQGKGLLATEGVVTVPMFRAAAPVLAVNSHFYEFLDPRVPYAPPLLAHELEHGRTYEVVLSTRGGLLRYRLGDLVRVDGALGRTPCLRFVGRADDVVDLVGEKLSAARAGDVLAAALAGARVAPQFAMLAPAWERPPGYRLYVEAAAGDDRLDDVAARIEAGLCEGTAYRYARELGQLGAVRAVRVRDGLARYEARRLAHGQRAGSIKPVDLSAEADWHAWFDADARETVAAAP